MFIQVIAEEHPSLNAFRPTAGEQNTHDFSEKSALQMSYDLHITKCTHCKSTVCNSISVLTPITSQSRYTFPSPQKIPRHPFQITRQAPSTAVISIAVGWLLPVLGLCLNGIDRMCFCIFCSVYLLPVRFIQMVARSFFFVAE